MYLGIDIGTSAVKGLLCDAARRSRRSEAVALQVASPGDYGREQDPEDWWRAVVAASRRAGGERGCRLGTAARHWPVGPDARGPVLLDADAAVIRPVMLWNDGRAHAEAAALTRAHPDIGRIVGVPPHAGFGAPKLLWLARHEPAAHARIARILAPKDWIGYRLHGQFGTDMSDAAGTLWFDQATRAWAPDLARASATDPAWLPPCREGSDLAGHLTRLRLPHLAWHPACRWRRAAAIRRRVPLARARPRPGMRCCRWAHRASF